MHRYEIGLSIVSSKNGIVTYSPVMGILAPKGYPICSVKLPLTYTFKEGWDGRPGSIWRVTSVFAMQKTIAVIPVTAFPFTGLPSEIKLSEN